MKNFLIILIYKIILLFTFSNVTYAEEKLLMITDKNCIFCIVWEKEIGKIYPKTDIAKQYPIKRIEIKYFNENIPKGLKKAKVTPTFLFIKNDKVIGEILGYSNPEMFWWRVDEILEQN